MRNTIVSYSLKILLLVILSFSISSCYNPKTHGKFISDKQDVWMDGYAIRIDEHKEADKGLVFCRANVQEDGSARPECFKVKFYDRAEK